MNNITINESLARGLAKRTSRELKKSFDLRFKKASIRYKAGSSRKGSIYRSISRIWKYALAPDIILQVIIKRGEKNESTYIIAWGANQNTLLVACIIIIDRKDPKEPKIIGVLSVSKHAAQRIFERLNSIETSCLKNELRLIAIFAMFLTFSKFELTNKNDVIRIKTENGVAYLGRCDLEFYWIVVTWKSKKMFNQQDIKAIEILENNRMVNINFFEKDNLSEHFINSNHFRNIKINIA